jgi:hypothetical protein
MYGKTEKLAPVTERKIFKFPASKLYSNIKHITGDAAVSTHITPQNQTLGVLVADGGNVLGRQTGPGQGDRHRAKGYMALRR